MLLIYVFIVCSLLAQNRATYSIVQCPVQVPQCLESESKSDKAVNMTHVTFTGTH